MINRLLINLKNDKKQHLMLTSSPLALVRVKEVNEYIINDTTVINNQAGDYVISQDDTNGFSIIFVAGRVQVPKMNDIPKGRCINLCSKADEIVTITPNDGVVINPADGCYLRRRGSFATLIYLGDNHWQIIGELP